MSIPSIRPPAVAGRFYPGDPAELRRTVERLLGVRQPIRALGAMVPHAGYVYSGGVAGETFRRLAIPETVIILSPNHTGRGVPISVYAHGAFAIPGATVPIDEPLAAAILAQIPGAQADQRAHEREHAVEVELPFLVALRPDVRIVPIILGGLEGPAAEAVGAGLARAVGDRDVLILASSDMSHYLPDRETRALDRLALDQLARLDPATLWHTVEQHDITMCGILPAVALLAYGRARGARRAELTGYATSGDASGDYERVVGYAGAIITLSSEPL